MLSPKTLTWITSACIMLAQPAGSQTIVYSGRTYLKAGRSWAQIWQVDAQTGQRRQLTITRRDHQSPWCASGGRSILFTAGNRRVLYRFDRKTRRETLLAVLDRPLLQVIGTISRSQIMLQEDDGSIEIVDIDLNHKVRTMQGYAAVLAPNRRLVAWTTSGAFPRGAPSHVMISDVNGSTPLDLGEGSAPAFTPDSLTLRFVRGKTMAAFSRTHDTNGPLYEVQYDIASQRQTTTASEASEIVEPYKLTISPDGVTTILSACCGGYGSPVYWRKTLDGGWSFVDGNLSDWGGWSQSGLLIYATDGHDLRPLDSRRSVWIGDIKLYDSRTSRVRTVVSGVSMNQEPRWCSDNSLQ